MSRGTRLAAAVVAVVALMTSTAAVAQAPRDGAGARRTARIGFLYPGADHSIFRANLESFRRPLAGGGFVEGRNLALEIRFGDGRANLTGVFMDLPDLAGKWLEILKTAVPSLARVAVLWDPAPGPAQLDAARRAAQVLKLALHSVEAGRTADIAPAFAAAARERPHGMIVLTSPIFNTGRREIVALAQRHRLPTLVPFPGYAEDGGLVAYGPEVSAMYAQAGALARRILEGRSPAEIPVERPAAFVLSLNLGPARTLGITIPPALLARANAIIE